MKGELQYQHILGSASHPPSALKAEVFLFGLLSKTKSSMEGNYVARNTHKEDNSFGFEEHTWGTSWRARNYACSFCKREFKSAQALGGHMNVHRRDRARLRSSLSSWVSDSPKPNPSIKPNNNPTHLSPSSPSHKSSPFYSPSLTLSSYSFSPASTSGDKKPRIASQVPLLSPQSREIMMISKSTRSAFGAEGLKGCAMEDEHKVFKNNEHNITLELGIGLLKHPNEKLDLELRLGH